jgi:hypothetical protein
VPALLLVLAALVLAGCSGGGGSAAPTTGRTTARPSVATLTATTRTTAAAPRRSTSTTTRTTSSATRATTTSTTTPTAATVTFTTATTTTTTEARAGPSLAAYQRRLQAQPDVFEVRCGPIVPADAANASARRFDAEARALAALAPPASLRAAHRLLVTTMREYAAYWRALAARARALGDASASAELVAKQQRAIATAPPPRKAASDYGRAVAELQRGGVDPIPAPLGKARYEQEAAAILRRAGDLSIPAAASAAEFRRALGAKGLRLQAAAVSIDELVPPHDAAAAAGDLVAGLCSRAHVLESAAASEFLQPGPETAKALRLNLKVIDPYLERAATEFRAAGYKLPVPLPS